MAEVGTINIPAGAAIQQLTLGINVTGWTRARIRVWLGTQLMKLAALVIGCNCEVTLGDDKAEAFAPSLAIPPLRLSVPDIAQGDIIGWGDATRIRVLLDGVEVRDVLAYDGQAGWVERNQRDEDGDLILNGAHIASERVHGIVTAEWRTRT